MGYSNKIKEVLQNELNTIENAGIFKKERYIHSVQAADIEVEFPTGSSIKKLINMLSQKSM